VDITFEPVILPTRGCGPGDRDIRRTLEEDLELGLELVIKVKNAEEAITVWTMELIASAGSRLIVLKAMAQTKLESTSISQQVVLRRLDWMGKVIQRLAIGRGTISRRSKALEEWSRKRSGKE
jgi:hypothetical protein